jgi:ApbE superfamily uncharacterized protein (UPF0280 family)
VHEHIVTRFTQVPAASGHRETFSVGNADGVTARTRDRAGGSSDAVATQISSGIGHLLF